MNAVITGATKGIGKSIALKLAEEGFQIAFCARTEGDVKAFEQQLSAFGSKAIGIVADLSVKTDVISFYDQVISSFGRVDVLVNNVGLFFPGSLLDEEDESYEMLQRLNLNAAFYLSKYFGNKMRTQGDGHIFNICSIASTSTITDAGSYGVTKTALLSLNDILRKELAAHQVKVTAVLPGPTYTDSWKDTTIDPSNFVQPSDIAAMVYTILNLSKGVNVDQVTLTPLNFNK